MDREQAGSFMGAERGDTVSESYVLGDVMESLDRQIEALTKARDLLREPPAPTQKPRRQGSAKATPARILSIASRP